MEQNLRSAKKGQQSARAHKLPQDRRSQANHPSIADEESIASLRESAEQLRLFVEQAPVSIAMFDRDMRYLAASGRWLTDHALREVAVVGRSHYEVSPEIPSRWKEVHRCGLAGETVREEQDPFPRADGRLLWLRWEVRPWHAADRSIGGILIFVEDVTARVEIERALRDSQEDLNRAQAVARTGSWRLDVDRNELTWSAETHRIFGVSPVTPLRYESFLAAVHPDDRDYVDRSWKAALAGAPYDIEHRIIVDNKTKWVRERAGLEFDAGGKLLGGFGTVQDITDKKQTEEKLRQSEARYRMLHESLRDPFVQVSMDGRIVEFNDLYCQMLGYSPDEMRALTYQSLTPERWHDFEEGIVRDQIIPRGYSDVYEKEYRRKDGAVIPVELRAILSRDARGRPDTMWAIVRDISQRKQAEAALRESEERFRGIFEHAGTGIAISDIEGRFQYCNPAFSAMLGYTEAELRRLTVADLQHPDDREMNLDEVRRLVTEKTPSFEISSRYLTKDGKSVWVHKHVSLLRDAAGKPASILALVTDITERRCQEEQIKLLMSEVNHRSKNLLTLVLAIARQTVAATADDFIDRFQERTLALSVSQDLLVRNNWKGVHLDKLARSQLAHFNDLIGTRIEISGPPLLVSASAAQTLGMALHELATNAGKYGALSSDAGRVEITWGVEHEGAGDTFVMSWHESGGPIVKAPAHNGFGSTVIAQMAEMSLNATVNLDYAPGGLVWRLRCPISSVLE